MSDFAELSTATTVGTGFVNGVDLAGIDAALCGPGDHFGVVMHGVLENTMAGRYQFDLNHDEGVRVLIDGVEVHSRLDARINDINFDLTAGNHKHRTW